MRRFHIYIGFIVWLLTSLFAVSCTDELEGNGYTPNSSSNLHVLVPTVLSSRGTNPDDASGLPTYNATVDECQINDLTLYAFPTGNEGKLLVETLPAPLASMMLEQHVANYQLNIEPGTYHIYVVANMNKVLSGQTIRTEDDLKKIVLGYEGGKEPGMPVSTNIPMIYEPKDVNGTIINTKIEKGGKKYTEVAANLKFTCVKVKLNLIFDPSNAEFGGKTFSINSISADKLSPFTHLYWGGKFVAPTWTNNEEKEEYKTGIQKTLYDSQTSETLVYYNDWSDNRSASATNNNDDIKGTGTAKDAPDNAAGKWLFQQTYYLPERYISSESDRSYLTIKGNVGGSVDNNYRINLGHKKDETSTTEVPVFPRGTFYEITGAIKTLGNIELDCKVSVKPWETVPINADFNHTTLWVSKTEANVTSTTNDIILYNSNAAVEFGCINTIFVNGKNEPIIIQNKRGKDANGKDSIEFRVNPAIPVSAYLPSQQSGTAKFYLKANNLWKYIDVHYDVTPYLDVTKELVIYYNSTDPDKNKRTIKWDTNLGGIKLEKTSSSIGNSTINMSLSESNAATGTFTVTAANNPITTTIHEFKVTSKDDEKRYQTVRVKVRPPVDDYRIYFRAINDRNKYTNGTEDRFQGILPEGGSKNWSDGWNANSTDTDESTPKNHHIYVYTQIGETTQDGSGKIEQKRWIYTDVDDAPDKKDRSNWPGERMVADNTNTGWYYKDFAVAMKPVRKIPSDEKEDRKIKPGETLIMFNNCENVDAGYTKHRCPHHMEPGIPLFDYEDHEGWIVYDPTSDPEWHMYDDMPEIENIAITIYTQERTWGWWKNYGIKGGGEFIIEDKTTGEEKEGNSWTLKDVGNNWWKTVIHLKAIKGEHNKNITINLKNGRNILLFDGNSFKDDTGYYEGGKWYQGKPKGVSE